MIIPKAFGTIYKQARAGRQSCMKTSNHLWRSDLQVARPDLASGCAKTGLSNVYQVGQGFMALRYFLVDKFGLHTWGASHTATHPSKEGNPLARHLKKGYPPGRVGLAQRGRGGFHMPLPTPFTHPK